MTSFVRPSLTPPGGMFALLLGRDDPLLPMLGSAPSPLLPTVVVDLLRSRVAPAPAALQAALESDRALHAAAECALALDDPRSSALARAIGRWGVEHVVDRVLEAALVRQTLHRGAARVAGTGPMLRRHLWACAGAARAMAQAEGAAPATVREAQTAAALHRVGADTFEAYVRLLGHPLVHRLAHDDLDLEREAALLGVPLHRLAARVLQEATLPRGVWAPLWGQGEPRPTVEAQRLAQARRAAHLAGYPADGDVRSVPPVPGEGVAGASEAVERAERLARAITRLSR